jgi:hypothetical protein
MGHFPRCSARRSLWATLGQFSRVIHGRLLKEALRGPHRSRSTLQECEVDTGIICRRLQRLQGRQWPASAASAGPHAQASPQGSRRRLPMVLHDMPLIG